MKMLMLIYLPHNKPYFTFYILQYMYALVVNLHMNSRLQCFIGHGISALPKKIKNTLTYVQYANVTHRLN